MAVWVYQGLAVASGKKVSGVRDADNPKLLRAVDLYDPKERPWIYARPQGPGPGGGDMPQRFSPALMRSDCMRSQPTVRG